MANLITYTVLTLGECKLHQLHTSNGKVCRSITSVQATQMNSSTYCSVAAHDRLTGCLGGICLQFFVMGEVAVQLFQETPTSFLQVRTAAECRCTS
jgi:hypothetical protein